MSEINRLLDAYQIPKAAKVRQFFNSDCLKQADREVLAQLEAQEIPIHPGDRIAITAGSRGIDQYVPILKAIIAFVKSKNGAPFIVPAMGSHGGATAEGQQEVLRRYGVTEETVGAPIISSMEVCQIGITDKGLGVYIDRNACEADGIILFNRVKPHTSFRGKYESGLIKMLAIGLAKQKGAEATHFLRYENMAENIMAVGRIAAEKLNIVAGVGTIENGYSRVAEVHVCRKQALFALEPQWLEAAWARMPRIALQDIDVLVVNEIGKEISGTGMDTNIIGRFHTNAAFGGPNTVKLGVLGITEKSEGNANGMGLADFMSRRMYEQVDFESTYVNTLTSTEPNSSRMPMVLDDDRRVFQGCVKLCGKVDPNQIRMVVIRSTKHLDEVYMSPAAVEAADAPIEVLGEYAPLPFDETGRLCLF